MNPFESSCLVKCTVVAGSAVFVLKRFIGEESENVQAVVYRNINNIFRCKRFTVKFSLMSESGHKSAAVNPNGNGQLFIGCFCRSPDIQIQTILTALERLVLPLVVIKRPFCVRELPRRGHKLIGFSDSIPRLNGLRSFPTKLSDRRGGKRYSLENCYVLIGNFHTGYCSGFGLCNSNCHKLLLVVDKYRILFSLYHSE